MYLKLCYIWNFHRKTDTLKNYILFLFFIVSLNTYSQVFWTEDFNNGCSANCDVTTYTTGTNGAWSVTNVTVNGSDNNTWYVSSAEQGSAAGLCSSTNGTNACLHIGSNASLFMDVGAAYSSSGGGFNIITDLRAESPVINCTGQTNITLSFTYIENGDGANDNADLWYFDGTTWALLFDLPKTTSCGSDQSTWATYTQTLPASADNNPNIRIGFRWINNDDGTGTQPSIAVDDITLSATSTPLPATDSILAGTITPTSFCGCDSIDVPYIASGAYTAGNVFTVQLSDASGSFAAPSTVGTLTSTATNDTIACAIPCSALAGTGYRVRVNSSTPAITGNSSAITITVNAAVTPTVSINATFATGGSICNDTALFTAVATAGGTAPVYQWELNGTSVGTDSVGFSADSVLLPGDVVSITLISNAACTTVDTVDTTITVMCNDIFIGAVPGLSFCSCDTMAIPYTSVGLFGSGNIYSVQLSDSLGSFITPTLIGTEVSTANSGTIQCLIPCATATSGNYLVRVLSSAPADTSAVSALFTINTSYTPSVSMSTTATTALCIDTAVTFLAVPVNGGSAPVYQWQRNGVNVGANSPIYTTSGAFVIGEVITVLMMPSATCPTIDTAQAFTIIDCPQIEIPNVFTPNGDGINDVFKVNLSGNALQNFRIDIYDRWGLLIFTSESINYKWDGRTTSGKKVVEGTYFYIVELNGTVYKGHVMVFY